MTALHTYACRHLPTVIHHHILSSIIVYCWFWLSIVDDRCSIADDRLNLPPVVRFPPSFLPAPLSLSLPLPIAWLHSWQGLSLHTLPSPSASPGMSMPRRWRVWSVRLCRRHRGWLRHPSRRSWWRHTTSPLQWWWLWYDEQCLPLDGMQPAHCLKTTHCSTKEWLLDFLNALILITITTPDPARKEVLDAEIRSLDGVAAIQGQWPGFRIGGYACLGFWWCGVGVGSSTFILIWSRVALAAKRGQAYVQFRLWTQNMPPAIWNLPYHDITTYVSTMNT